MPLHTPLGDVRQLRDRDREACRARTRPAGRGSCRSRRSRARSRRTSGLSVAALISIATVRLDVVEQVAARAVHLRRAAQRVGVLHLVAPAVRLEDRRALEQQPDVRGRRDLAAHAGAPRGSPDGSSCSEPCSASSDIAQAMSAARASRRARTSAERGHRRHELGPVDQRQALLRLQPHRRRARPRASASAPGSALAADPRLALADERQRQVCERGEVTARPDRARGRDERHDARR